MECLAQIGVAAPFQSLVMLEVETVTEMLTVQVISHAETTIAEMISHRREVIGHGLLTVVKVTKGPIIVTFD